MSDVQIIFPNSKAPVAERLREAIARAGFAVAAGGGVAPDEAPAPSDAGALLFLWDRSSIKQPGLQQAAAAARHRGRAIDVSADGITPVDLIDENRLIHLSGWREQATHPGWRKILAELERLCGGHRTPAAPVRPVASAAPAAARSAPGGERAAAGGGKAKLVGICAAILLALVLAGYLALSRRSVAVEGSPQPPQPKVAAAQPMATPTSGTASTNQMQAAPPEGGQSVDLVSAGDPGEDAAAATGEAATGSTQPSLAATTAAPLSAPIQTTRASARPHAAHPPLRGVIRYTRYAKTMRLFCQRSGRHTPECRTFNAALAAGR